MKIRPNRMFRRKEVAHLHIRIGHLENECDQLAYAYNDLMSWADWINLKMSELYMIRDALENRIFSEVVYGLHTRLGMRQTYEDLLEKIKKEIKRRDMI